MLFIPSLRGVFAPANTAEATQYRMIRCTGLGRGIVCYVDHADVFAGSRPVVEGTVDLQHLAEAEFGFAAAPVVFFVFRHGFTLGYEPTP